jgi:hypothetical protein
MEIRIARKTLSDGSRVYNLLLAGENVAGYPVELELPAMSSDHAWDAAKEIMASINLHTIEQITSITEEVSR